MIFKWGYSEVVSLCSVGLVPLKLCFALQQPLISKGVPLGVATNGAFFSAHCCASLNNDFLKIWLHAHPKSTLRIDMVKAKRKEKVQKLSEAELSQFLVRHFCLLLSLLIQCLIFPSKQWFKKKPLKHCSDWKHQFTSFYRSAIAKQQNSYSRIKLREQLLNSSSSPPEWETGAVSLRKEEGGRIWSEKKKTDELASNGKCNQKENIDGVPKCRCKGWVCWRRP